MTPKRGEFRSVRRFTWLPTSAGFPVTEWRWLEWVTIRQEYVMGKPGPFWTNREFLP